MSNNGISEFPQIESQLKNKPDLETVYFEGNVVERQNNATYRLKLKLLLPQIKQIDATGCR